MTYKSSRHIDDGTPVATVHLARAEPAIDVLVTSCTLQETEFKDPKLTHEQGFVAEKDKSDGGDVMRSALQYGRPKLDIPGVRLSSCRVSK
jgi:hypothetical protein